jgi:hypothetical protein
MPSLNTWLPIASNLSMRGASRAGTGIGDGAFLDMLLFYVARHLLASISLMAQSMTFRERISHLTMCVEETASGLQRAEADPTSTASAKDSLRSDLESYNEALTIERELATPRRRAPKPVRRKFPRTNPFKVSRVATKAMALA